MFATARGIYHDYPGTFWTLIGATFVDRLGGALLFPFFALFVTDRFGVGMTEVGILFTIFAVASVAGSMIGGALTDRLGRRWMIIFGLIVSALSSLMMGIVTDLQLFFALAAVVGLLGDVGGPAQQAMIADLLEGEKRAEGYGIQRVAVNLAVAIGPAIGGLLATKSYMLLFVIDALTSIITAGIVYFALPETKPVTEDGEPATDMLDTIKGYGTVARDHLFMAFWAVSLLTVIVYQQLNSTLSVYLRDEHSFTAQEFGYLLSLNAAMVVLFQFWITRRISRRPAMLMMAAGTALYAVGFALFGLVTTFGLFILAIIIITIGEMIVTPVAQALVAQFAPEDMRGRYMAVFGFTWTIPFAIGPLLAGLIIDNYNPDLVWYLSGVIGLLAVGGYLLIYSKREKPGRVDSSLAVENRTDQNETAY